MRVHLHLGVHKTATTKMQETLANNTQVLDRFSIRSIPMRAFRAWRGTTARAYRKGEVVDLAAQFEAFAGSQGHPEILVLSDENSIGNCGQIIESGALYPRLLARLDIVAGMLARHEVTVFVAIREYGSFLASAHCEAARGGARMPFRAFANRLDLASRRWPEILDEIAGRLPDSAVVVWRYEDFHGVERSVFEQLLSAEAASALKIDGAIVRPSLPDVAMRAFNGLADWMPALAGQGSVRLLDGVSALFPHARKYAPWTDEEALHLARLYEQDVARIRDNRRVRFLELPAPGPGEQRNQTAAC